MKTPQENTSAVPEKSKSNTYGQRFDIPNAPKEEPCDKGKCDAMPPPNPSNVNVHQDALASQRK